MFFIKYLGGWTLVYFSILFEIKKNNKNRVVSPPHYSNGIEQGEVNLVLRMLLEFTSNCEMGNA